MNQLFENIKNSNLSEITKSNYYHNIKNIIKICETDNIETIINDIDGTLEKITKYCDDKNYGIHSREMFIKIILVFFKYIDNLKLNYNEKYKKWIEIHNDLHKPVENKYLSNEPTDKQKNA